LARAAPFIANWQRDFAVSLYKLGFVARALGHSELAADYAVRAVEAMQKIILIDAQNPQWRQELEGLRKFAAEFGNE